MKSIRIVSDGMASGTKVYTDDGTLIDGITAITIDKIEPSTALRATIEFIGVKLDAWAKQTERTPPPPPPGDVGGITGSERWWSRWVLSGAPAVNRKG